ncbi:hypothetical protein Dimus_025934 [Dionaea muscipula]
MDKRANIWKWRVSEKKATLLAKQNGLVKGMLLHIEEDQEEEEPGSRCRSSSSDVTTQTMASSTPPAAYEGDAFAIGTQLEALAGREKKAETEEEAACLRQELDKPLTLRQGFGGFGAEERLALLDAALKDCMDQIESLRQDQDERIRRAVSKASMEFDKEQKKMESKLTEANRRLTNLAAENTHLTKALLCKETLIDDLDKHKVQLEAESEMLMARLDSAVKENTLLKYECSLLEEQLEIRNEERELSQRSAAALHKQYLESMKEIKRLETLSRLAHVEAQLKELSEDHHNAMQILQLATSCNPPPASHHEVAAENPLALGDSMYRRFWLQEILRVILQEHQATKRSFSKLLDAIKLALACRNYVDTCETDISASGFHTWASPPHDLHPGNNMYSVEEAKDQQVIKIQTCSHEEHRRLKDKLKTLESEMEDMEIKLQSAISEKEILMTRLQESNESVETLRTELETLKETNVMIEDQIDNQRLINEDLDNQLTVAKLKLSEILQKLSSLEIELEDRDNCFEELEATCLELRLQLETLSSKGTLNSEAEHEENNLKTDWKSLQCSAKTVDCQEITQSPEKQWKAMSMEEMALPDNVFSSTSATTAATSTTNNTGSCRSPHHHSSLRDHMLAEDNATKEVPGSPKTKEIISIGSPGKPSLVHDNSNVLPDPIIQVASSKAHYDVRQRKDDTAVSGLAVVPIKNTGRGFGFIRKLFLRRKKGSNNKAPVPLARNTSKLKQSRELFLIV